MKITGRSLIFTLFLSYFLLSASRNGQSSASLPRSTPEKEGVSSQGIIDFLDAAAKSHNEFHSIMFLRHGKVITEGWWNPYRSDLKHTLYSTSKSFTATAVGLAESENKLSVNDKVISFFPQYLPDTVSAYLSDLKVKDLLSMSAGMDPDPTFNIVVSDSNWVKAFLALPVINEPGTKFLYNSLASYMLSAIVQKATGEKVIDYLKPRLFSPLAISGIDWEVDPRGINTGGWGLRLKTEDMAKFGQLFLQKGKWNGKQVLPSLWIEEATSLKIFQDPDAPLSKKDSSDWLQGYCYQMWRCRHNCYRADGAYGQYIIVMPDQDAIVAITSETGNMQDELNLVWDYLLPAIKSGKLPEDPALDEKLNQKLSSLALRLPDRGASSEMSAKVSGKTFTLEPNEKHFKTISFQFIDNICRISLRSDTSQYHFAFGSGRWIEGETTMSGPDLLLPAKAHAVGLPPAKVAGSFGWEDESTLKLVLRYIESPHTETIICRFNKNNFLMDIHFSDMPENSQTELKGVKNE